VNETTLRTLDILSREIGNQLSIYKLVDKIREKYGTAYYKQIYDEIKKLEENNTIKILRIGRSTSPSLNFNNPILTDKLAQIELERKIRFLEKQKELEMLISEFTEKLRRVSLIQTIALVSPEKNMKLNRIELFIILHDFETNNEFNAILDIRKLIDTFSALHNIRVDPLFMQEKNFIELLKDDDANIARKMITDKIIILYPQAFWAIIKSMLDDKIRISINDYEINPAKISEQELIYNLARFGYKEFGYDIKESTQIRIEYIITSILLQEDIRKIEAIPIILAKKENTVNYNLLLFLSQKFGTTSKLLGILIALNQFKHLQGVRNAIRNLKALKIEEIEANLEDLGQKMKLYNVIR